MNPFMLFFLGFVCGMMSTIGVMSEHIHNGCTLYHVINDGQHQYVCSGEIR